MKSENVGRRQLQGMICVIMVSLLVFLSCADVKAMTCYESDGVSYEEGYIFVGESHIEIASTHMLDGTDHSGRIPGLDDVMYHLEWDGKLHGIYNMKGNLFFVFGGMDGQNEEAVQTGKDYIYSDGKGQHGIAVTKIHEIMDHNPNIAHWNIISYHGSVQAKILEGRTIPNYYAASYRNWMEYEFPQADIYFLSISTMTKYYRGATNPDLLNQVLKETFPDHFLDYTEFYNQRYPQEMWDPTLRSDTVHWSPKTYTELVISVIQEIQYRRENVSTTVQAPVTVADVETVFYTNENTVIYAVPDWNGEVLFAGVETGLPIHVTGITDNGYFRVDLDEITAYVFGSGLSEENRD